MIRLYEVRLLRKFVAGYNSKRPTVYAASSWQYAWQDRHGFLWLRGKYTGWEFSTCSKPGVDFAWPYGVDPRTPEEQAAAKDVPAAVSDGEEEKAAPMVDGERRHAPHAEAPRVFTPSERSVRMTAYAEAHQAKPPGPAVEAPARADQQVWLLSRRDQGRRIYDEHVEFMVRAATELDARQHAHDEVKSQDDEYVRSVESVGEVINEEARERMRAKQRVWLDPEITTASVVQLDGPSGIITRNFKPG